MDSFRYLDMKTVRGLHTTCDGMGECCPHDIGNLRLLYIETAIEPLTANLASTLTHWPGTDFGK